MPVFLAAPAAFFRFEQFGEHLALRLIGFQKKRAKRVEFAI